MPRFAFEQAPAAVLWVRSDDEGGSSVIDEGNAADHATIGAPACCFRYMRIGNDCDVSLCSHLAERLEY